MTANDAGSEDDRSFEFLVQRDLESIRQAIVHVGDTDDAHQFAKHRVSHPLGGCRRSVRRDAVVTTVGHADGNVDQFTDERVQLTGAAHDLFEHCPRPLQRGRMICNGFPEVVDVVRLSSGSNVVVDFADHSAALFVFDQWLNGISPAGEGSGILSGPLEKFRTLNAIIQESFAVSWPVVFDVLREVGPQD